MNTRISSKAFTVGLAIVGLAAFSSMGQTIYQSGGSGTTYTDALGDQNGSSNPLRDLSFATISNDANNLYITLGLNPVASLATNGSFNYIIGITTGNPSAGGDTNNPTTHGNPYGRAISFDPSFGGMTDFIGAFGAGGSGSVASPFHSFGYNDYVYTNGVWGKVSTVSSNQPIGIQPSTTQSNEFTLTVPMSDFAANLSLTPGTSIDFDIDSTGTSGNQTAYDSLVIQTQIQATATYSATAQFNETVLDQYTITAVPEPSSILLVAIGLFGSLAALRRRHN